MAIQKISISKVKPNQDNPRLIKDDKFKKLVQSIIDFPEMLAIRPIVVNKDMIVLGGNMRLKACIEAGLKEVPIIIADNLTDEQQREFLIKDNVSGGEWNWEVLANEWNSEELEAWGLDLPEDDNDNQKGKIVKENIKPFIQTHVLISFPPEKMIYLQELLEQITKIEGVEYEQSSN